MVGKTPAPSAHSLPPDVSLANIEQACSIIDPVFRDSPQFEAESLSSQLDCSFVVKVETANPIRSFKARGAQFFVSQLRERVALVCASAGNFGQGMAWAARQRGLPITVFTPTDASPMKIERMRALGAEVRAVGTDADDAIAAANRFAEQRGALVVKDGREAAIAEGAGSIGLELLRMPTFDAVILPLGDGGLISGVGTWIKAHSPQTRVIGVSPSGSPAMERSLRQRKVVSAPCATIADALAIRTPFAEALNRLQRVMDDLVTVEDSALIEAMRLAHRELGVVLEPGGAAGLAAASVHKARFAGQRVAVLLTGGNLSESQMRQWLG
jgi:threonine dehydratase